MHRTTSIIDDDESKTARSRPGQPGRERAPTPTELPPAELIATQQMSNVGLLAAGLAHDLNNLLTVILGSAELARDLLPKPSPARHHLHTIEATVRRAGDLCRTMLACARTDQRELEAIDANALVRDTVTLLQSSSLALHRVRLDLAVDVPALQASPAQFRQVVMNLLANAAEACGPRGGRIRISTTPAQVDARLARQLRPTGISTGRFLRLRVADDGCGMDAATQQQLFTPFFTHKGPGRGLGLASLLEIVRAHNGGVRVFSEPGRGAIFDVFLPQPPSAAAVDRLQGTVLVADDEEILRHSLSTFLTGRGLTVHSVANGEAAVAHITAHPDTDLLLIDLHMPRLGGLEALTALRAGKHLLPAILMTGDTEGDIANRIDALAPVAVLTKPFSLVELLRLLGKLLPQPRR